MTGESRKEKMIMNSDAAFTRWFLQATGNEPYPFQIRVACGTMLPKLMDVLTGMGRPHGQST